MSNLCLPFSHSSLFPSSVTCATKLSREIATWCYTSGRFTSTNERPPSSVPNAVKSFPLPTACSFISSKTTIKCPSRQKYNSLRLQRNSSSINSQYTIFTVHRITCIHIIISHSFNRRRPCCHLPWDISMLVFILTKSADYHSHCRRHVCTLLDLEKRGSTKLEKNLINEKFLID